MLLLGLFFCMALAKIQTLDEIKESGTTKKDADSDVTYNLANDEAEDPIEDYDRNQDQDGQYGEDSYDEDSYDDEDSVDGVPGRKALAAEIGFFKSQDKDGDGKIGFDEYVAAMEAVHEDAVADAKYYYTRIPEKLNSTEHRVLFEDEDTDKDGAITLEEWLLATFHDEPQSPYYGDEDSGDEDEPLTQEDLDEARKHMDDEFQRMDKDKSGFVGKQEMLDFITEEERVAHEEDPSMERIPPEELKETADELFMEMDINKDGQVTVEEMFKSQFPEASHSVEAS